MDMLGVRYRVLPGAPPAGANAAFVSPGYWVEESKHAVPRAFIPRNVLVENDQARRLDRLSRDTFDARALTPIETDDAAVSDLQDAQGTAQVIEDLPCHVSIETSMSTPGLLVLSDRWDPGWSARVNEKAEVIVRANHVLRGVRVPAGRSRVDFAYQPSEFRLGLILCGVSGIVCMVWWIVSIRHVAQSRKRNISDTIPA
jgi:hypothetical protein